MLRPGKKFYKHPSLPAATVVVLTALLAVPTAVVLTVRAENQASTKGQDADLVFSNPANLGPTVNSSDTENDPGISADGLSLYFNSYRPGGLGSAEIWVTTRKTKADPWGTPVNLGPMVNSSANENAPSLSADGLSLYFGSDRPGGYGGRDLWVTTRKTTTDAWAEPVNLGPVVNTSAHEHGPSISSDGLSLYFSEYAWTPPFRPGGIGGGDLWVTTRKTKVDPWTTPVNLGPIVNSSWWDASPSISTDGLSLYFNSNRPGGFGDTDLWVTTRKTKGDPWGTPVNLGPTVNSAVRDYNPDICADGSTLYFASKRSGAIGGSDDSDIWQVSLKPEAKLGKSLHDAAADGDIEKVRSLISKGADVNAKNQDGLTPLHLAARFGRENMVELLISKGANVDVKDERGRAPIIFAVWGKHKETIKLLLAKGADVNTTMIAFDAPGASRPLHEAIYDGNLDIAKLLIANGADVNAAGEFSWTPLHCAVACGDRDLVELLLAKGSIGPVFHVAACKGDLGGVKRLLAQGRNVDEKDEQDCTPLYWSVATGQKEVVEFLLTSGADVNMRNGTGDAPLHRAIRHKKPRRDIVELLIAKGADVNMRSGWGGTYQRGMVPLHFAAIGGQKELVEMLLRNGADVSAKDGNGATALHYAVENAHKQIVSFRQA